MRIIQRIFSWISASTQGRVILLALASRFIILTVMLAADGAFTDLDSSKRLQRFPCSEAVDETSMSSTNSIIDGLAPWDSVYFIRIAKCGYENDMVNAFFPLLPLLMRYTAALPGLSTLCQAYNIPVESLYAGIGVILNLIAFCVAAVALYRLTLQIFPQDDQLAAMSVFFFCFNPASVFYSAVYTESLFAACTWSGLVLLGKRYWAGVAALTAAGAARSNGILSAWFLMYPVVVEIGRRRRYQFKIRRDERGRGIISMVPWRLVVRNGIGCVCVWSPYIAMQVYAYKTYCTLPSHSTRDAATTDAATPPSWCFNALPSIYGYVQATYWDVGFLRFYRHINRWPWLLQSAPVLYLSIAACWTWASTDWRHSLTVGLLPYAERKKVNKYGKNRKSAAASVEPFLSDAVGPFIYHLAGMTAMAALVMHVNVATRFLSSSPALYWYIAVLLVDRIEVDEVDGEVNWIWLWALVSAMLGCLLFPNFFPWT